MELIIHFNREALDSDQRKQWCQFSKTVMSLFMVIATIMTVKRPGSHQMRPSFHQLGLRGCDLSGSIQSFISRNEPIWSEWEVYESLDSVQLSKAHFIRH